MSSWQVGDLAVRYRDAHIGANSAKGGPGRGQIIRVDGVINDPRWSCTGLIFNGYPSPHRTQAWSDATFRKIRPDEREACEPEFVTLLKRSKRKVEA